MYRLNTVLKKEDRNILLHQGGLGDLIACLPSIKYILTFHPHIHVHLWTHDYGVPLCQKAFKGFDNIIIKGMSRRSDYDDSVFTRSPYSHKITNLSSNMVEHAFYTIVHKSVPNDWKNYIQLEPIDISEFALPEKYVVVTTGYTSPTRAWRAESVNETVEYIIQKGYTPVFLGKSFTGSYDNEGITGNFNADYTKGINLIDKTDLFQAHGIMANAAVTIGVDNGLLHLCGMSQAKSIWGFTTVDPLHRLPFKDGVQGKSCGVVMPTKQELGCIGCQSNMVFASQEHSFTSCIYDDFVCLDLMGSDKWIKELEKVL